MTHKPLFLNDVKAISLNKTLAQECLIKNRKEDEESCLIIKTKPLLALHIT